MPENDALCALVCLITGFYAVVFIKIEGAERFLTIIFKQLMTILAMIQKTPTIHTPTAGYINLPGTDSKQAASAGAWMQTASGHAIDYLEPEKSTFCIEDIALGLARQMRYSGQTCAQRCGYSVAQHSVLASFFVPKKYALHALLHDASEAFMGDLPSPLKALLPNYVALEKRLQHAICRAFFLNPFDVQAWQVVKEVDVQLLATERDQLMVADAPRSWGAIETVTRLPVRIEPLGEKVARELFLQRFEQLADDNDRNDRLVNDSFVTLVNGKVKMKVK